MKIQNTSEEYNLVKQPHQVDRSEKALYGDKYKTFCF